MGGLPPHLGTSQGERADLWRKMLGGGNEFQMTARDDLKECREMRQGPIGTLSPLSNKRSFNGHA